MTEQEAFEKWASVEGSVLRNIEMRSNGQYQNSNTQHAWRGWKECAALKEAELASEKAGHEAWEAEHIKDMGELNKRIKELELEIEKLGQVRCEGCGYPVSAREHLGCHSEKTLKELATAVKERNNAEKREHALLGRVLELAAQNEALVRSLEKGVDTFELYASIPASLNAEKNQNLANEAREVLRLATNGAEILRKHDVALLEQAVKYILSDGCHDFIAAVKLGRFGKEKAE
jgi:hypothetical protein